MLTLLVCAAFSIGPDEPPPMHRPPSDRPVIVLDAALTPTAGRLVKLLDGTATVLAGGGTVTVDHAAAIVAADVWGPSVPWTGGGSVLGESNASDTARLDLIDGSSLTGALLTGGGDTLTLVHGALGKIETNIDRVARVRFRRSPVPMNVVKKDTILLSNGDTLEGFVSKITPGEKGTLIYEPVDAKGKASTVALALVDEVRLANPLKRAASGTAWLHAEGGERGGGHDATTFSRVEIDGGTLRLWRTPDALPSHADAGVCVGLLLTPERVVPFATCAQVEGASITTVAAWPAVFGARDVSINELGTAAWTLPTGATRVTGWMLLPQGCREWGNVTVTIEARRGESRTTIATRTLTSASPEAPLDASIPNGGPHTFVVTLTDAGGGPVQDRVTLRNVLIARDVAP